MSSEKEPFSHEWFQMVLTSEIEILNKRKTYTEQEEEGEKKIQQVLVDIKIKHPSIGNSTHIKSAEEIYDEMKNDKNEFPQLWNLEGTGGVHDLMQKRVPQNIAAPIQREIYPRQEKADWRRFHPKRSGWGKYHNMTYEEFSRHFQEECINNLFAIAEWIDHHPNHPMAEYYIKTIFNK